MRRPRERSAFVVGRRPPAPHPPRTVTRRAAGGRAAVVCGRAQSVVLGAVRERAVDGLLFQNYHLIESPKELVGVHAHAWMRAGGCMWM